MITAIPFPILMISFVIVVGICMYLEIKHRRIEANRQINTYSR